MHRRQHPPVASPQSLSEADRRLLAEWAADCAEHVLEIFESAMPAMTVPGRSSIEPVSEALRGLPRVGTDRSGPLGSGLLTTEPRGSIISRTQAAVAESVTGADRFAD